MVEPCGNFIGNDLVPDPVTGFLTGREVLTKSNHAVESKDVDVKDVRRDERGRWLVGVSGVVHEPKFNSDKKTEWLKIYAEVFPNSAEACRRVGISKWTLRNHLAVDLIFSQAVEEIKAVHVDEVHAMRFQVAKTPAGAYDRDRLLYGYMPEVYNPKTVVEVQHTMNAEQAQKTYDTTVDAVDAQVIETVKKLKAQSQRQRR